MVEVFFGSLSELSGEDRKRILSRAGLSVREVVSKVAKIVEDVRKRGDRALIKYTRMFDGVKLSKRRIRVSQREIREAYKKIPDEVVQALRAAAENIERFHRALIPPKMWMQEISTGVSVGQIWAPIESVGLYVPGGLAAYPSTVLMTAIPARVAGVEKVIACTPPASDGSANPAVLVASDIAGVDEVFRVGGAQAIAAMAYGTETIPRVQKIVGPGNIYVTAAKILVYGDVDIDFPAGPSEIMIVADESANPEWVAADLLSQAEHDPEAAAVLVATSEKLARGVLGAMEKRLPKLKNREVIERSLRSHGAILVAKSVEEAMDFANEYAPEHLCLFLKNPLEAVALVKNAGSVFIGQYSTVPAGDYCTGANHVLPTSGAAKFTGGLSTEHFLKKMTIQQVTEKGLLKLRKTIVALSHFEGLDAHAAAVEERFVGK